MDPKHRKTLGRVPATPTPADIRWADMESMLRGAGVELKERSGSRIALVKDGQVIVVQRPHPNPLTERATVRDIAAFLETVGVKA